jgi:hypothetical protein
MGKVFEVGEQYARPVSAPCGGLGGGEGVHVVREEWGVDGISKTRRSRAHFRSKHILPKHTQKGRSPRFAVCARARTSPHA